MNTLTLLKHIGVSEAIEPLKEVNKHKLEMTDNYSLDYTVYLFEEKEKRRHTFGKID